MLSSVARLLLAGVIVTSIGPLMAQDLATAKVPTLRPVSPGSAERLLATADRCPTFSWSSLAAAEGLELAVVEVAGAEAVELAAPDELVVALEAQLPGGALSWTPSADRCLEPGQSYAWLLRAEIEGRWTDWSEPSLFRIAERPSAEEVEWAYGILERYLAEDSIEAPSMPMGPTPQAAPNPAPARPSTAAPAGSALTLRVQGKVEALELRAIAIPPTFAGDIHADAGLVVNQGSLESPLFVINEFLGSSADFFSFRSVQLGRAIFCRAGTSCETSPSPAANGRLAVGKLTARDLVEVGTNGGMQVDIPLPNNTFFGSGGGGFFEVPSAFNVRVDDNESGCSGGVVVGVRLAETDADQIGVQVKCSD